MRVPIILLLLLVVVGSVGCGSSGEATSTPQPSILSAFNNGVSGMAQIDSRRYLAVHDRKSFENGFRLSILTSLPDSGVRVDPVSVDDWKDEEGRSSDLEAAYAVPNRPNEFLLLESGSWEGKYGRLFHVKIDPAAKRGTVLGVVRLPKLADNGPGKIGDQYEGMVVVDRGGGSLLVILGERGGSQKYPNGILRWGMLDLSSHSLTFTDAGTKGIELDAPGEWSGSGAQRDIADLWVDPDNRLWAVACSDPGDIGPYRSAIYYAGDITGDDARPIRLMPSRTVWRDVAGFKVEALSGPSSSVAGSVMSIGIEDEAYGGGWRAIR